MIHLKSVVYLMFLWIPLIHSMIYSTIHSMTHSFFHSIIHSTIHSMIHSIFHLIIHSLIHSIFHSLIHSSASPCSNRSKALLHSTPFPPSIASIHSSPPFSPHSSTSRSPLPPPTPHIASAISRPLLRSAPSQSSLLSTANSFITPFVHPYKLRVHRSNLA